MHGMKEGMDEEECVGYVKGSSLWVVERKEEE